MDFVGQAPAKSRAAISELFRRGPWPEHESLKGASQLRILLGFFLVFLALRPKISEKRSFLYVQGWPPRPPRLRGHRLLEGKGTALQVLSYAQAQRIAG